jgi:hypothetical protein
VLVAEALAVSEALVDAEGEPVPLAVALGVVAALLEGPEVCGAGADGPQAASMKARHSVPEIVPDTATTDEAERRIYFS